MRRLMFLGPTGAGLAADQLTAFERKGPAVRGDLLGLLDQDPGLAVIVDGTFQQDLSISHREILMVLEQGWRVIGLSSMGAIRAAEMAEVGMTGYGAVFDQFRADPDFRDDEVALLHAPSPYYFPLSEPLVHLRSALRDLSARGELDRKAAGQVLDVLFNEWFGARTIDHFYRIIADISGPETAAACRRFTGDLQNHQVKRDDLISFLKEEAWT